MGRKLNKKVNFRPTIDNLLIENAYFCKIKTNQHIL